MTIKFYCPNCDALIAFDSKHAGKRARCTTCSQIFIIPSKDNEKPEKIKPPPERADPIPGFYRAVFVDTWKIFATPKNITPLVFVAAVVCFKFFLGHLDYTIETPGFNIIIPVGWTSKIIVWGCLFWYYTEIINATAFDADELPEVYMGGLFGFVRIWYVDGHCQSSLSSVSRTGEVYLAITNTSTGITIVRRFDKDDFAEGDELTFDAALINQDRLLVHARQ